MLWWQFALVGAAGGTLAEFVALYNDAASWQAARRTPSGRLEKDPAPLHTFVDLPAHVWMLVMRALIGAASAGVFAAAGQLKGVFAALALGYCGPLALGRLGQIPSVDSLINGTPTRSPMPAPVAPSPANPATDGPASAAQYVASAQPGVVRER